MTSYYKQWEDVDVSLPETPVDHSIFSGLMRNKDYSKYLRQQLLDPQVFVEITSKCNFYCSYCNSPNSTRPKGMMDEKLFRHIAQQLKGFTTKSINLHIDGEPTIHPKFVEYTKILNEYGLRVGLASNGSTLQDSFHELEMDISTYISTCKEEFEERAKISYDRFNDKVVRYLSEWWVNDSNQNIDLKVYCPAEEANQPNMLREKYDWLATLIRAADIPVAKIDYGAVSFFQIVKKNGCRLSLSLAPIVAGGLFPETELYRAPKFTHKDADFGFCDSAWSRITIFCDGSIGLCCHGLQGETIYTRPEEIWEQSLTALWLDHPYVKAFRENMERGKLLLDGCKPCLSRYPQREFYVKTGVFVPDVNLVIGNMLDYQGTQASALVFGFAPGVDRQGNLWTVANRPQFGFGISTQEQPLQENLTLEINGIAFAPAELGQEQFVDVLINGVKVGRWMLIHGKLETYRAEFASKLLRDHKMMVALRFTDRKSPSELNLGADKRKLGLGISRIAVI